MAMSCWQMSFLAGTGKGLFIEQRRHGNGNGVPADRPLCRNRQAIVTSILFIEQHCHGNGVPADRPLCRNRQAIVTSILFIEQHCHDNGVPVDRALCRNRQAIVTSILFIEHYSIHVPGWLLKWLNLITAHGSVSNEPGSVTWPATKYLKTVSLRNHTEKLTTLWPQNISFWPKINIPSSYFTILMLNCLENTLKLQFDSYVTAVKFLT